MKNLFFIILAALFFSTSNAYAADGKKEMVTTADCKAGCGNDLAPGNGTGPSVCWVTFIAAEGYDDFKAQIFSPQGVGLLKNKKGQIAIRGGEGTKRISVDCSAIRRGTKLVSCFMHDGLPVGRVIKGDMFKGFLPNGHRQGGVEIKL
jgi:hypothetical protein